MVRGARSGIVVRGQDRVGQAMTSVPFGTSAAAPAGYDASLSVREEPMTWIDKLEIGLKNNAGKRKDNLPPADVRGPEVPAGPGRSPVIPAAEHDKNEVSRLAHPVLP